MAFTANKLSQKLRNSVKIEVNVTRFVIMKVSNYPVSIEYFLTIFTQSVQKLP